MLRAFVVSILLISSWPGSAFAQEDRQIDVDGKAVHVVTYGLHDREAGRPVFIFENGAVSPLESWRDFPRLASDLAPVVVYDRATIGKSEWDGEMGAPEHVTSRLWSLLEALEVAPPYILVGWSWGGDLALNHAIANPQDVSGLVLVDAPLHSGPAALEVLRSLGLGDDVYAADVERMRRQIEEEPATIQADVTPILRIMETRSAPDLNLAAEIPIAAFVAGYRSDPPSDDIEKFGPHPYDFQKHLAERTRDRTARAAKLVENSENGILAVLPKARHAMHVEHPDLILAGLKFVLNRSAGEEAD